MADPAQRASDAERERVAERLRVAAGDGRLDHDELEERLEAALAARTRGELEAVTSDLPAGPPDRGSARLPVWSDQTVRAMVARTVVVCTICIAVWALTGAEASFWPKWVLLGTGIGLLVTIVPRLFGVDEEHERDALPKPPEPPRLPGAG